MFWRNTDRNWSAFRMKNFQKTHIQTICCCLRKILWIIVLWCSIVCTQAKQFHSDSLQHLIKFELFLFWNSSEQQNTNELGWKPALIWSNFRFTSPNQSLSLSVYSLTGNFFFSKSQVQCIYTFDIMSGRRKSWIVKTITLDLPSF